MPLARLTSVTSGASSGAHRSRLARNAWAGTTSNTVVAPSRAPAASEVADTPAGNRTVGRYRGLYPVVLICSATAPSRLHSRTGVPASTSTLANVVPHAPAPITATAPSLPAIAPP